MGPLSSYTNISAVWILDIVIINNLNFLRLESKVIMQIGDSWCLWHMKLFRTVLRFMFRFKCIGRNMEKHIYIGDKYLNNDWKIWINKEAQKTCWTQKDNKNSQRYTNWVKDIKKTRKTQVIVPRLLYTQHESYIITQMLIVLVLFIERKVIRINANFIQFL